MTGYVRKDTSNNIADGNIINSADLDAEFDGVVDAFNASTGHKHDGTAAEGAPITVVGPTQDVVVSATTVTPKTTNTVDIGSTLLKFKDIYIVGSANLPTVNATTVDTTNVEVTNIKAKDGTSAATIADSTGVMTIASSILTTADINGGTIDGTAIGGSTAAAGAFTTLSASGALTLNGGTANGVAYLNGSKVLTTGSALTFDGTNLGIGTSSPGAKLHVKGGNSGNNVVVDNDGSRFNGVILRNNGSDISQWFYDNTGGSTTLQTIGATSLVFGTSQTERARIDSSGNLLVGKTSTGVSVSGSVHAASGAIGSSIATGNDTFYVYNTTAAAYRFYVTDAGTVFATNTTISAISDRRFKENIRDLDAGLDKIMALKPRLYDWKAGKGADIKNARGFIAQEFEQVFPDLIDEWKDPAPEGEEPYKSVRQDLIPVLVKAIQEQQAIIEQLKADVAALKGAA